MTGKLHPPYLAASTALRLRRGLHTRRVLTQQPQSIVLSVYIIYVETADKILLACLEPLFMTTPQKDSSDDAPETAGAMLRQARIDRGLTLADIAAVTRIPRNMLEHLERDRFDEYTASAFARGHLINFAREVRLDPERVLVAFERQTGQVRPSLEYEPSTTPPKPRRRAVSRLSVSLRKRYPQLAQIGQLIKPVHMVAALLMLCALFAGAFFLNGSSATAQDAAAFSSPDEEEWSLEKDSDQTRWFLEQPASP